jgi:hypothetical protein
LAHELQGKWRKLSINLFSIVIGRCKTENENNHGDTEAQRIAELKKVGIYKIFFFLVFSVFSVPLW